MPLAVMSLFLAYMALSGESGASAATVKCWSADNQYLNRGDNATSPYVQIQKFCRCAAGTYEYRDFKVKSLVSADKAYMFSDAGENDVYTTVRRDTRSQVYSVKCYSLFGGWYNTDKDYYTRVDDTTTFAITTFWTLWPTTTGVPSSDRKSVV